MKSKKLEQTLWRKKVSKSEDGTVLSKYGKQCASSGEKEEFVDENR